MVYAKNVLWCLVYSHLNMKYFPLFFKHVNSYAVLSHGLCQEYSLISCVHLWWWLETNHKFILCNFAEHWTVALLSFLKMFSPRFVWPKLSVGNFPSISKFEAKRNSERDIMVIKFSYQIHSFGNLSQEKRVIQELLFIPNPHPMKVSLESWWNKCWHFSVLNWNCCQQSGRWQSLGHVYKGISAQSIYKTNHHPTLLCDLITL